MLPVRSEDAQQQPSFSFQGLAIPYKSFGHIPYKATSQPQPSKIPTFVPERTPISIQAIVSLRITRNQTSMYASVVNRTRRRMPATELFIVALAEFDSEFGHMTSEAGNLAVNNNISCAMLPVHHRTVSLWAIEWDSLPCFSPGKSTTRGLMYMSEISKAPHVPPNARWYLGIYVCNRMVFRTHWIRVVMHFISASIVVLHWCRFVTPHLGIADQDASTIKYSFSMNMILQVTWPLLDH